MVNAKRGRDAMGSTSMDEHFAAIKRNLRTVTWLSMVNLMLAFLIFLKEYGFL